MGGSARRGGNALPAGEANIAHDPIAAQRTVVAPWAKPPLLVGLDVTLAATLRPAEFALLAEHRSPAATFLDAPLRFYREFGSTFTAPDTPCHDLLAVLAAAVPEIVDDAPVLPLAVDCGGDAAWGTTVVDFRAPYFAALEGSTQSSAEGFAPWRIALGVDADRFRRCVRTLFGAPDNRSANRRGRPVTVSAADDAFVGDGVGRAFGAEHEHPPAREVDRPVGDDRAQTRERGGAGLARDDTDRREVAHRLLGRGVVDRDEHVGAGRHRRPGDDRDHAAVQAGHDRVVRSRHLDGMAGRGRPQPARGRQRLDHDDRRVRRSAAPPRRRARRRPSVRRRPPAARRRAARRSRRRSSRSPR